MMKDQILNFVVYKKIYKNSENANKYIIKNNYPLMS